MYIDWKEIPHYVVINKTTKQIDTQVCKVNANKISTFIFFREVNCQCLDYRREYVIVGYLLQDIPEAQHSTYLLHSTNYYLSLVILIKRENTE